MLKILFSLSFFSAFSIELMNKRMQNSRLHQQVGSIIARSSMTKQRLLTLTATGLKFFLIPSNIIWKCSYFFKASSISFPSSLEVCRVKISFSSSSKFPEASLRSFKIKSSVCLYFSLLLKNSSMLVYLQRSFIGSSIYTTILVI